MTATEPRFAEAAHIGGSARVLRGPETTVTEMRWARTVVDGAFGSPQPESVPGPEGQPVHLAAPRLARCRPDLRAPPGIPSRPHGRDTDPPAAPHHSGSSSAQNTPFGRSTGGQAGHQVPAHISGDVCFDRACSGADRAPVT